MGKKYGNYHLQYLFDDLHVIYMFFTYYVNFQLFQWAMASVVFHSILFYLFSMFVPLQGCFLLVLNAINGSSLFGPQVCLGYLGRKLLSDIVKLLFVTHTCSSVASLITFMRPGNESSPLVPMTGRMKC